MQAVRAKRGTSVTVEILYLAWNRRAFTEATFTLLRENTDWRKVSRLVVYDDGSTDGTDEWLLEAGRTVPVPAFDFRPIRFRSPPATMNDYLATSEADVFAKIDSDIAMPKGWLKVALDCLDANPDVDLLGLDAGMTGHDSRARERAARPASHIGGVGLMRTAAFHTRPSLMARGRHGFTNWQQRHTVQPAWMVPGVPTVELDRVPGEPWASLAAEYVRKRWAREWPKYSPLHPWWGWVDRQLGDRIAA